MALENTQEGKTNVEVVVSIMYSTSWLASFPIGFAWHRFVRSFLFNIFRVYIVTFLEMVSLLAEVRLRASTLDSTLWEHRALTE